jgi:hypothetical protein
MTKPTVQIKSTYRIDGGNTIPVHGKVNHSLICQNGDGEVWADSGRNVKTCSEASIEVVGTKLAANADANQPHIPAKWIRAEKGDVLIEAPNGTLYLSARNIVIAATGPETENSSNGNIDLIASNDINLDCKDTIKMDSVNMYMNASLAMDICGKSFLSITGGLSVAGSGVDSKSILSVSGTIINGLTGLGGLL